ncbi:MAG: IS4 family transposase [Bacteroidetes bacterium]|nr:IS4 family transposase [Bacteroidota bacterium]
MRSKFQFSTGDFQSNWDQRISPTQLENIFRQFGPRKRRPPVLPLSQLFAGYVFHVQRASGSFASNVKLLTGQQITDSALSQRRGNIPWMVFERILDCALGPKADPTKHPGAFYGDLRLMGIDGSQFSVSNTPQNKKSFIKAASRRMKSAFGKLGVCVLTELGLHNPVAASVGAAGMSEQELSQPLIDKLPPKSLLLGDRAYGLGCWIKRIKEAYPQGDRDFLFRVKSTCKTKVLEVLPDGSAWVEIRVDGRTIQLREIRGQVRRPGAKWSEVRLWTSLRDWKTHEAKELLALYARRWEHEIFYKELKVDMRSAELLSSHTETTAAQEIAALILAHAIVVDQRMAVAEEGEVDVLRISFRKTLEYMEPLWLIIQCSEGLLTGKQIHEMTRRIMAQIAAYAIPPRRKRSCPRAVRKPIGSWPRLLKNTYQNGDTEWIVSPIKN